MGYMHHYSRTRSIGTYIIGLNYHGHYLHAGGLSVNNYVRENKVREVMSVNEKFRENIGQFQ